MIISEKHLLMICLLGPNCLPVAQMSTRLSNKWRNRKSLRNNKKQKKRKKWFNNLSKLWKKPKSHQKKSSSLRKKLSCIIWLKMNWTNCLITNKLQPLPPSSILKSSKYWLSKCMEAVLQSKKRKRKKKRKSLRRRKLNTNKIWRKSKLLFKRKRKPREKLWKENNKLKRLSTNLRKSTVESTVLKILVTMTLKWMHMCNVTTLPLLLWFKMVSNKKNSKACLLNIGTTSSQRRWLKATATLISCETTYPFN